MKRLHSALYMAVVQVDAGLKPLPNLARIRRMVSRLRGLDVIALPEVFSGRGNDAFLRAAAEPFPGTTTEFLSDLAEEKQSWVLGGSVLERVGRRIFNTSVLFNRRGQMVARYRKIHLFEAKLESGQIIRERDVYSHGSHPVLTRIGDWSCGMSICYDVRFPEMFRYYSARGANALMVPSNFTQRTGKDHWEVLVRARAIENQCFVVAPNQCGRNEQTGVVSHGHSMIVGPWGEVLAEAGDGEQVITGRLDPDALQEIRKRIPALDHRRAGLF